MIHVDAPQSGYAGHQATYVPIFFANDSNESFLRHVSTRKKITALESVDSGDSKMRAGVNQIEEGKSAMRRDAHRQRAKVDMLLTMQCVALGRLERLTKRRWQGAPTKTVRMYGQEKQRRQRRFVSRS